MTNPFAVVTPESLTPVDVAELFVDVFSDFPKIQDAGHTFIHGSRGTGKSMMFRFLEPTVQKYASGGTLDALKFFAIHVPIKEFDPFNIDLSQEDRLISSILENMLIFHCMKRIIKSIKDNIEIFECKPTEEDSRKVTDTVNEICDFAGLNISIFSEFSDPKQSLVNVLEELSKSVRFQEKNNKAFLSQPLSVIKNGSPYEGAVCSYLDFLVPFAECIMSLSFTPSGPIYLMIDDADNLPIGSQLILNSWVYCRTTRKLCLKISTQMNYLTYKTTLGKYIESPHDFSEVDINTIYTSNKNFYYKRVTDITRKRLAKYGLELEPEVFFPPNFSQVAAIEKIKEEMRESFDSGTSRGSRRSDDSARYARPEYIRSLGGGKKNSATYSYAGFKSMVDLSSGVIRSFLELASQMFNTQISRTHLSLGTKIRTISYQNQDEVIYNWSEQYINDEFDKLRNSEDQERIEKLRNLIESLGRFFRYRIMNAEASERRLISIMVKQNLDKAVQEVLKLGIELGYLHSSTITNKEGLGRSKLYILNRRLAPYFKIDPSGYAAHLSVSSRDLEIACLNPDSFVRIRSKAEDTKSTETQERLI